MCKGVAAGEESRRAMVCHVCNKSLQARSLHLHLFSTHDIHQQVVVAEALLEERARVRYRADPGGNKGANTVLVPRMPWHAQQSLHAAPPFPGSTSKGHHGDP